MYKSWEFFASFKASSKSFKELSSWQTLGGFVRVKLLVGKKTTGFLGTTGVSHYSLNTTKSVNSTCILGNFLSIIPTVNLNVQVILCTFPYSTISWSPLQSPALRLRISHFWEGFCWDFDSLCRCYEWQTLELPQFQQHLLFGSIEGSKALKDGQWDSFLFQW